MILDSEFSEFLFYNSSPCTTVCTNGSEPPPPPPVVDLWLPPFFFLFVMLIGVVGNFLVLHIIRKTKKMRTVTDFYIGNLALTDILSLLVSVPFTASLYPLQRWIFGEFACRFGNYIQQVSVQVTSVTLLAMNMDRWYMATFPLETLHQRSTYVAGVIVCSIWLGSFLISTPVLVYTHLQQGYWDGPQKFCTLTFPTKYHEQVFILYNFFMVYLLPVTSNLICYTTILFQIGRAREDPNDSVEVRQLKERLDALRLRLTRTVSSLVLLYTICWGPTHFLSLLQGFSPHFQFTYCLYRLKIWARCMSYISFSINPILYAFLGKNFQKSFKKELPFLFKKRPATRARNSVHMEMQVLQ